MGHIILITIATLFCIPGSICDPSYYKPVQYSSHPDSYPTYTDDVGHASYAPSQDYYPSSEYGHEFSNKAILISPKERRAHLDAIITNCAHPRSLMCRPSPSDVFGVGYCVDYHKRCDGYYDCPLGEDEKGCTYGSSSEFTCSQFQMRCCDTGKCANPCDGVVECANAVDERNCNLGCEVNKVQCSDGTCAVLCDGVSECPDGEDEMCGPEEGCLFDEYRCPGAGVQKCAPRCDSNNECAVDLPNENCFAACTSGGIGCEAIADNGLYINICAGFCNNEPECVDGRDEDPAYCKICADCEGTSCVFEDECADTSLFPVTLPVTII